MITKDSIDRLRDSIDIVDLVSNYTQVRKVGSTYMALCPFHDDKVASMSLSRGAGLYYCHACGASGNAIKFIMEHERLDFPGSVEYLAKFFNVTLEYSKGSDYKKHNDLLESLSDFYHNNIFKYHDIMAYLYNRGIDKEDIINFKIGYSDSSFATIKFINDNNLSKEYAQEYGIISNTNDKPYAKFARRIMFPIYSANGMIVGFGGRTLDSNNPAKYINSSQSKIFNKSKILYGYSIAKRHIYKQHSMIVCEGYLDVVMLHKAGFRNAVATLGTSINDEHLYLLGKDNPKVIMCYDGDSAGIKAAIKVSRFLAKNSIDGGVILLDNGLDPADMISMGKANDFANKLSKPIAFPTFVFESIINMHDLKSPMDKEKAIKECADFLNTLSETLRLDYHKICADMLGVPEQHIPVRGKSNKISYTYTNTDIMTRDRDRERFILFNMINSADNCDLASRYLKQSYFKFCGDEFVKILNHNIDEACQQELGFAKYEIRSLQDFSHDIRKFMKLYIDERNRKLMANSSINSQDKQQLKFYLLHLLNRINKGELVVIDKDLSGL